MFSDEGKQRLLEALKGWDCRLQFTNSDLHFYPDPGYPKFDQRSEDNPYGGPRVLTWKFTVPRATGLSPTQDYRLVDNQFKIVYSRRLEYPFTVSQIAPSVLYVNIALEST